MNVREQIETIISDVVGIEIIDMKEDDTNLRDDLGFDSLDFVEVIMHIEKDLNIVIDDDDAENVETIKDLENLVSKLVK